MKTKLLEWLSTLGVSNEIVGSACTPIISSPLMLTMTKEFRHNLDLLYREMSGSIERVEWESALQKRVKTCERLTKADLRLLITTANGLGISPVPLTEEPSGIDLTVLRDDEENIEVELGVQKSDIIDPEENLVQKLMEELRAVKEEMIINKRNSEILYMELSRVKHKIAMDEENGFPDEKIAS